MPKHLRIEVFFMTKKMKISTEFYDEKGVTINPYITASNELVILMFNSNDDETEKLMLHLQKQELKQFIEYLQYLHDKL